MPGLVIFGTRWNIGSDDLIVPGLTLFLLNTVSIIVCSATYPWDLEYADIRNVSKNSTPGIRLRNSSDLGQRACIELGMELIIGHIVIFSAACLLELFIALMSLRGTIMESQLRKPAIPLLYIRFSLYLVELLWSVLSGLWLFRYYSLCETKQSEIIVFTMIIHGVEITGLLVSMYALYDPAGRKWLKMKKHQMNLEEMSNSKNITHPKRCRSGSTRNWRQRKVAMAYQKRWRHRCSLLCLCCCISKSERNKDSLTAIAKLLSEFFGDLDVVVTDILAGLILLRRKQKKKRLSIINKHKDATYDFLSGVRVTPDTEFVSLSDARDQAWFKVIIRYMRYASAAYGWPLYMVMHPKCGCCQIVSHSRCCKQGELQPQGDNCCACHLAAAQHVIEMDNDTEILYASFDSDVEKTAFFVALDYLTKSIVITIRGTLSTQDIITDLKAEEDFIPISPLKEDWIGHGGIIQAATYVKKKLEDEDLIAKAQAADPDQGTKDFKLVVVGHSLGAGTAAILSVLLRETYPNLECYSFAPPGGLLSSSLADYTKEFVTSFVLGKDLVPRIGLSQLEMLRKDIMEVLTESKEPKWKILASSLLCCQGAPKTVIEPRDNIKDIEAEEQVKGGPSVTHTLLYPPGKIIHLVRRHITDERKIRGAPKPVYQAIWADKADFDEVLISPVMVQDHMPQKILYALEMVLKDMGPAKPHRTLSHISPMIRDLETKHLLSSPLIMTPPRLVYRETSFTSLDPYVYAATLSSASSKSSHSRTLTANNLPYGIGIEYLSCLEEEIVEEMKKRQANTEACSIFPPKAFMFKEWSFAPCASPESASEVSSLRSYKHKRSYSDQSKAIRNPCSQKLLTMNELSDSEFEEPFEADGPIKYIDTSNGGSGAAYDSPLIPVLKNLPVKKIPSLSPHLSAIRKEVLDLYSKAAKSVRSSSQSSSSSSRSEKSPVYL
ncbi:diacylglycerol lipase-alpha-like isoform X2 [Artemia franciscana]|uniref:sn-1-specific diacylglycerol lipase n=1 Tax=Artemia franciscana TaxID=6661 RepID=A0AA88HUS9_ARTSF|nr:hypothetical protein QYM36_006286 [Artemia franciscana]